MTMLTSNTWYVGPVLWLQAALAALEQDKEAMWYEQASKDIYLVSAPGFVSTAWTGCPAYVQAV
jgi:hypothetical protein